jgi:hypothetical protein
MLSNVVDVQIKVSFVLSSCGGFYSQRHFVFMVTLYFLWGVRPPFISGLWDHPLFPIIEWRLAQRRSSTLQLP